MRGKPALQQVHKASATCRAAAVDIAVVAGLNGSVVGVQGGKSETSKITINRGMLSAAANEHGSSNSNANKQIQVAAASAVTDAHNRWRMTNDLPSTS